MKWPIFLITAFAGLLIISDVWLMHDGVLFHLALYLSGKMNNSIDFSRIAAVIMGDGLSFIYYHLGGESFRLSRWLFSTGHAQHIFYPLFLLLYLRRKEPELSEWAVTTLSSYLLSLMVYRSMCFFFLITELNVAHTMTWLMIISYFAQHSGSNLRVKRIIFATSALLGTFSFPLTVITASLLLLLSLKRKDRSLVTRLVCILVILLGFSGFIHYNRIYGTYDRLFRGLSQIRFDFNVWFTVFSSILIFMLKKNWQMIAAIIVLLLANIFVVPLTAWQGYGGSLYALIFVICFQALFIFWPSSENPSKIRQTRMLCVSTLLFLVMVSHAVRLSLFFEKLKEVMDSTTDTLTFAQAKSQLLPDKYQLFLSASAVRMQSISLRLLDSKIIDNYIEKDPAINTQDLAGRWGDWDEAEFLKRTKARGIEFKNGSLAEKGSSTPEN